jgi:hypothetical protein
MRIRPLPSESTRMISLAVMFSEFGLAFICVNPENTVIATRMVAANA